jgi:hypothetical protein
MRIIRTIATRVLSFLPFQLILPSSEADSANGAGVTGQMHLADWIPVAWSESAQRGKRRLK